ncbi:MAG: FHA domain-containing protein [Nitrospiraceae bacterium]|nr:MAG: FHA domain-containing protein [Nitrospiraceae bacterium]
MLKLVQKGDGSASLEFSVTTKPITIGRGEGNTLLLKDPSVSFTHAKVMMRQGIAYIKDLQSTNGIFVNGEQISPSRGQRILPGDEIKIGVYTFALEHHLEEADTETKLAPPDQAIKDEDIGTELLPMHDDQESEDSTALELENDLLNKIEPSDTPNPFQERDREAANVDAMSDSATILMDDVLKGQLIPKLVIVKGEDTGREFPLDKGVLIIGRSDDNDIVLNDPRVSRGHHAKVMLQNDKSFVIEDLNSKNGVFFRGQKIDRAVLRHEEEIQIGETVLKYIDKDDSVDFSEKQEKKPASEKQNIHRLVYAVLTALILVAVIIYVKPEKKDEEPVSISVPVQTQSAQQDDLIQNRLKKGIELINSRSWIEAIEELSKIIQTDQQNFKAKELIHKAEAELMHKNNFDKAAVYASQARYEDALKVLEEIPVTSVYFDTSGEETRRINKLIIQSKRKQKAEVRPLKKAPGIDVALDMYVQGQARKAISLLKEIQTNPEDRKKAGTLIGFIQQAEESFQLGTKLYNDNNIDGAVSEWKKTLLYEKELPIRKKSWYAKMIASTAADEFYRKGLVLDENGDHDAAVTNWIKAVSSDPTHKRALSKLEKIASKLYDEGSTLERTDKAQARKKWNEILTIVPPGSRYYKKAAAKLE